MIPHFIFKLSGKEVNYEVAVKSIKKQAKRISPKTIGIKIKEIKVKYSASYREEENEKYRSYLTSKKKDWAFAVTWDLNDGILNVYPNCVIHKKDKSRFIIKNYIKINSIK
jgi:hypothetical protein